MRLISLRLPLSCEATLSSSQLQLLDQLIRNRVGVQAVALLAEQNHHAQQDGQYGQHQPPGQRQAAGVQGMFFHGLACLLRYFSGVMS